MSAIFEIKRGIIMRMYKLKIGTIGECSMVDTIMLTIRGVALSTVSELYKKAQDSRYTIIDLGIVQCLKTLCFLRPDDTRPIQV